MTGYLIRLGTTVKIKDGKLIKVHQFRDASHAIRSRKSKKMKVVRSCR